MSRRSIMVTTPKCGQVYISAPVNEDPLSVFWHNELNSQQRMVCSNWLSHEGWFAYANGVIELEDGLFDRIQQETPAT
jgi:hypothetical protein